MELFEQIRQEYEHGAGSIRAVAKKVGVHRRSVRQALKDAMPPERKKAVRAEPRLGPLKTLIDGILEADRTAPRKQRHTAHRIYVRIQQEIVNADVSESTVRRYVRQRKRELCQPGGEVFVAQTYAFGDEAQVDFHEPPPTVKCFFSAQRAAVVLITFVYDPTSIRIPEGRELAGCTMGSDNVSRCCQLVHGFKSLIDLRSHRDDDLTAQNTPAS